MDVLLPVEGEVGWRRRPWLVASLDVNALNFCGFGGCAAAAGGEGYLVAVPAPLKAEDVSWVLRLVDWCWVCVLCVD